MATNILMPALSPTMEEGKLARWLVHEGDTVKSGDILAEIETDKATMEFEAVDEGRIGKILVPEGSEGVKVNEPIAVLLAEGEAAGAAAAPQSPTVSGKRLSTDIQSKENQHTDGQSTENHSTEHQSKEVLPTDIPSKDHIFASPLARRIAKQTGVGLVSLKGTGPRGRIVKADVEAAQKSGVGKTASAAPPKESQAAAPIFGIAPLPDARLFYKPDAYEEIPHDAMRKAIAKRLASAKTLIPHYYLTIDCRIDNLLATRARLNEAAPKGEGAFKLSVNDFLVKAAALALLRVPEVNASWTDTAILRHKHADIGIAVALDFGLITPIVFDADEKGLAVISNEVKSLAERARAKKLKPQEYEGGSFAISNLGMFGIREFTAVINPPHAAILAIGAGEQRAVVRDGKIEIA
ncbi:MAG TPA: pyruvate dehydrogenase complex dihydrolipoamide acetyltransferase, partial [Rhizomicrobium sp.]|nr:pyruvate dehydrogenase complex dihydrolipoamide acetyltransferase [Rhizomicrobium sp.]